MEVPTSTVNNAGKRWTIDEENRVLGMLSSGKSFKEIGKDLGRTATAIESRALMKVAKMVTPQMTIDCLAEIYGLSKQSLQERMDKDGREVLSTENKYKKWTNEEKDVLLEMYANRKSYSEIAQFLKRTPTAVEAKVLGITIQLVNGDGVSIEEAARFYGSTPEELKELIQSAKTKKYQPKNIASKLNLKKTENKEVTNAELKEILVEIRDLLRVMVTQK